MEENGWRAKAAGEGALQSPLSVASYSAYSSDGDAVGANGLGATGSRSSAMQELRERIQRERLQLQELEKQLSHRKPIVTTIRPSPAPGSVGTLRMTSSPPRFAPFRPARRSRAGAGAQADKRPPAYASHRPGAPRPRRTRATKRTLSGAVVAACRITAASSTPLAALPRPASLLSDAPAGRLYVAPASACQFWI